MYHSSKFFRFIESNEIKFKNNYTTYRAPCESSESFFSSECNAFKFLIRHNTIGRELTQSQRFARQNRSYRLPCFIFIINLDLTHTICQFIIDRYDSFARVISIYFAAVGKVRATHFV